MPDSDSLPPCWGAPARTLVGGVSVAAQPECPERSQRTVTSKLDFAIIGAQKSGTTSLYDELSQHPNVAMSRDKEPAFFVTDRSAPEWGAYWKLFNAQAGQLRGEASTMYSFYPSYLGVAERLHRHNPNLRVIYIMRNPVDRIISNLGHSAADGERWSDPNRVVFEDEKYLSRSRYWLQLTQYLELFPAEQVHPMIFEETWNEEPGSTTHLSSFLGIDPDGFSSGRSWKGRRLGSQQVRISRQARRRLRPLSRAVPEALRSRLAGVLTRRVKEVPGVEDSTRRELWARLMPEVIGVEEYIGRQIGAWRADHTFPTM